MGYVQHSAADEGSGGAVLFLLKAPLLHHQHRARRGEGRETCMYRVNKRTQQHYCVTLGYAVNNFDTIAATSQVFIQ